MNLSKTNIVSKFNCLQGDCPDTCCKGWSMQVDDNTFAKYKGTELEDAIAYDGQDNEIRVMKRDEYTDYCVKFTDGICGIHASKGADMLGDACYFYPRVTRDVGSEMIMTATLSCPEIVRLSLEDENGSLLAPDKAERKPQILKNYTSDGLTGEQMIKIHESFLEATKDNAPAERIMARIYSAIESLKHIEKNDWEGAAPFMLKMADGKMPAAESDDLDKFYTLQTFAAIFHATHKKMNERLSSSIAHVENFLGIKINWETLNLEEHNSDPVNAISDKKLDETLKRYLAAQLSFSTFPFAGLGDTPLDKVRILAYKFSLMRLFLSATPEDEIIKSIQSVARIIDHLGSPQLLFNLMDQFGWNTENRLRGLVGDK